jgi:hypothetical protein
MKWNSKTLTNDEQYTYVPVEFALVKETAKAIRIKIDTTVKRNYLSNKNSMPKRVEIKGICVWVPKSVIRNYTDRKAYIWRTLLKKNVTKEVEKYIRAQLGLDKEETIMIL